MKHLILIGLMVLLTGSCSHSAKDPASSEKSEGASIGSSYSGFAPTTAESFTREQIVMPKGQVAIEEFLKLAQASEDRTIRETFSGSAALQPIPSDGSAIFVLKGRQFMLYHDDLNNDGSLEYVVIFIREGSELKNGIQGAYRVKLSDPTRLESLGEKAIDAVMTPGKAGYQLAAPFVVQMSGARVLRFNHPNGGQHSFVWEGSMLSDILF